MLPGLCLNKPIKVNFLIDEEINKQGLSWEFDKILGACFNAAVVHAVFLEIFEYRHTESFTL